MNTPVPWLDRIAHDLRGPLSPVQTAVSLLLATELEPARQQELLQLIDRQARQLSRMIGELGDWSRAAQGTLLGERRACSPAAVLDNALSGANVLPDALRIDDASGDAQLDGDEWRLCQLLRILVDYQRARGDDLALSLRIADGRLQVEVRATMQDAVRPNLLTEPAPEPYDGGLGLNLLIARAIAEAHGGSLDVEQDAARVLTLRAALPLSTGAGAGAEH
jgi:signal transduction histidine kinase